MKPKQVGSGGGSDAGCRSGIVELAAWAIIGVSGGATLDASRGDHTRNTPRFLGGRIRLVSTLVKIEVAT